MGYSLTYPIAQHFLFSCNSGDTLGVYLNQLTPSINKQVSDNTQICGNMSTMARHTFYSTGQVAMLALSTDKNPQPHTGFKGFYNFVDSSKSFISRFRQFLPWLQPTTVFCWVICRFKSQLFCVFLCYHISLTKTEAVFVSRTRNLQSVNFSDLLDLLRMQTRVSGHHGLWGSLACWRFLTSVFQ